MCITAPHAFKQFVGLLPDQQHLMRYVLILEDRTVDITVDDQTGHFTSFEVRLGTKEKQQTLLKHWDRDAQATYWSTYEIPVSHFTKLLTTYS